MMTGIKKIVIFLAAGYLFSVAYTFAAGEVVFKEITLSKQPYENSVIYRFKNDIYFKFGFHKDPTDKYDSRKFIVLKKNDQKYAPIYISKGSGDSYILKPKFFSTNDFEAPLVILAEIGTEYSWGIRVFLVDPQLNVKDIGTLHVAVDPEKEFVDGPLSAVPYTSIRKKNKDIVFNFTTDVVFDPGGIKEKRISKDKIKYIYDGVSLKRIPGEPAVSPP